MSPTEPTQRWDPARYTGRARYVSELGLPVLALLAPIPGEHILDLGCGDGALTLRPSICSPALLPCPAN